MSTLSLSLSTFSCEGPSIFAFVGWPFEEGGGLTGELFGEAALKMPATCPKVAATAKLSSSSSSSSSLYRIRKPFLATPMPNDQGVIL